MPHSKSAKKRARQSVQYRLLNRRRKAGIKGAIAEFDAALVANDADAAAEKFKVACSKLQKTAARGTIHDKAASRKISHMAKRLSQVAAS